MSRLVIFFLIVLALAIGGAWLADHAGTAVIAFESFELHTSFAALMLLLTVVVVVVAALVWLTGYLRRELPLLGSNRVVKSQGRGLALLNQAVVALAADDAKGALRLIERAELLLPPQPMIHLVGAEAAMRIGDDDAATERFKALESMKDGKLLGQRGLAQQARSQGRFGEAKRLASKALDSDGGNRWALDLLFSLQVRSGEFDLARETLAKATKRQVFDARQSTQHRGALYFGEAKMLDLKGDRAGALSAVKAAIKDRPKLVPAYILQAGLMIKIGQARKAKAALKKAYNATQHPDILRAFMAVEPNETPTRQLVRLRDFTSDHALHPTTLLALAKAEISADHLSVARDILAGLLENDPSKAVWDAYAELLPKMDEDPSEAIAKAAQMVDSTGWTCGHCGVKAEQWTVLCGTCDTFDSLNFGQIGEVQTPGKGRSGDPQITLLGNI